MAKALSIFETAFDTYSYVRVIGEGGAGRVFEVRTTSNQSLALKCLRPEVASTDKRKRFKNEIDFCSKNRHPNIVQVLDCGIVQWEGKTTLFYVMPKYPETLRDRISKKF